MIGTPPVSSDARIVRRTSTWAWRLRPLQLVALGGEPALELRHHPVDRRQVLDRAARERAVELVQRPLRRQRRGPLDHRPLELAAQLLLEATQLLARDPVAARVVVAAGRAAARRAARARGGSAAHRLPARRTPGPARRPRSRAAPGRAARRRSRPEAPPRSAGAACRGRPRTRRSASWSRSVIRRRDASASAARKKKRSNTSSNTRRSSGDFASVAAIASLKSSCSLHGTWSSASNASRISEVPTDTPSSRRSSANASSCPAKPPGPRSGTPRASATLGG